MDQQLLHPAHGAERVYEALVELAVKRGKKPRIASLCEHQQWLRRQIQR